MKIVQFPHTALLTASTEVTDFSEEISVIAHQMLKLMHETKGVGLAANQVNILKRIIVMNCSHLEQDDKIFINPQIISGAEIDKTYKEGCLSFPNLFIDIKRPETVTVKWQDLTGNFQQQTFSDLEAVCIQHEIDHLNGINFLDRTSKTKKQMALQKFIKLRK